VVDALPLNASGKVLKTELRTRLAGGATAGGATADGATTGGATTGGATTGGATNDRER
jgi:hypothetical protein